MWLLSRIAAPEQPVKRDLMPSRNPARPEPPLLASAKLSREARRRVMLAALIALVVGAVVVSLSGAGAIGNRLARSRPAWIILAAAFELMSVLGFATAFQLVFGEWLPKHSRLRMGLAVCAATILVPAGGLLAIAAGARTLRGRGMPAAKTRSRAIAFLLITNPSNGAGPGFGGHRVGGGAAGGTARADPAPLPRRDRVEHDRPDSAPAVGLPPTHGACAPGNCAPVGVRRGRATRAGCHRGTRAGERAELEAARRGRVLRVRQRRAVGHIQSLRPYRPADRNACHRLSHRLSRRLAPGSSGNRRSRGRDARAAGAFRSTPDLRRDRCSRLPCRLDRSDVGARRARLPHNPPAGAPHLAVLDPSSSRTSPHRRRVRRLSGGRVGKVSNRPASIYYRA